MKFIEALERKGVRLSKLEEAATEFTPRETTLNGSDAWEFEGVTSQSLERLIDRFLDERPHFRGARRELKPGARFRFSGGETEFEVVSIEGGSVIYVEPGDPQRYLASVDSRSFIVIPS